MSDINTTLNACELVWRQQSIAGSDVADMRGELESHLREAVTAGKGIESVVGSDISSFARSWANVHPNRALPVDDTMQQQRVEAAARSRTRLMWAVGGIVAVTVLGAMLGPRGNLEDLEIWQWIFVATTVVLLIGEMLTGGFFVLPFGVAAGASSILAFARIEPPVLLLVFIIVSALGLWGLREFASQGDDVVVPVGANRYVGQHAVITEAINGIGTLGRARIDTENWRAITDNNEHIPAGAVVTIHEVRGARLVVRAG